MTVEYVHQEIGEEVIALAGYYAVLKELRLQRNGRDVLCVIGMCAVESSCCGQRSFNYAIVPGYVVNWKGRVNEAGRPITEVEPVTDQATKQEITQTLWETEVILKTNVEFW